MILSEQLGDAILALAQQTHTYADSQSFRRACADFAAQTGRDESEIRSAALTLADRIKRGARCSCGHPVYWCSTCETHHHQPWGDVSDCVRSGGPHVAEDAAR